jgi:hypothetical protein
MAESHPIVQWPTDYEENDITQEHVITCLALTSQMNSDMLKTGNIVDI